MKRKVEIEIDIPEEMDEEFVSLYLKLPEGDRREVKGYMIGLLLGHEFAKKRREGK